MSGFDDFADGPRPRYCYPRIDGRDLAQILHLNLERAKSDLRKFAALRNRRERQWARIGKPVEFWLVHKQPDGRGRLHEIYYHSQKDPNPTSRLFCMGRIDRLQRQDGVRK